MNRLLGMIGLYVLVTSINPSLNIMSYALECQSLIFFKTVLAKFPVVKKTNKAQRP